MKLILNTGPVIDHGEVTLPDDLRWTDEFSWVPAVQDRTYSLTGALIIETSTRQAGRPITLQSTLADMAWVQRSTVAQLKSWASLEGRVFTLEFEYPTDTRTFQVMFDQSGDNTALDSSPVKEFPGHSPEDWFSLKLKFIEV